MTDCATYRVPFASQLKQGGQTGRFDCTAWATSRAIARATCGKKVPSGRTIRLHSSEAIPDPDSPGLNLFQVAAVAENDYGVYFEIFTGAKALPFAGYEQRRIDGRPGVIQVGYGPIADTKLDAGRGFRDNHAIYEDNFETIESLADGRAPGVWKFDGRLYPRSVMKAAAAKLWTGSHYTGLGHVWCMFARDVIPDYRARVPAGSYLAYQISGAHVVMRRTRRTGGFSGACTPPRHFLWGSRTVTLVQMLSGAKAGQWISHNYAMEG